MALTLKEAALRAGVPIEWANARAQEGGLRPYYRYVKGAHGMKRSGYRGKEIVRALIELYGGESATELACEVIGLTPQDRLPDPDALWVKVLAHQDKNRERVEQRYHQRIIIRDNKPVLLALVGDVHFGNRHCDYASAKRDAETVRDTDGCFALVLGDIIDNWITPKTAHVQREQVLSHSEELAICENWLGMMREKLRCVISGNHEERSYELAGIDVILTMISEVNTLYDQYESCFTVELANAEIPFKVRHHWKGQSKYNPTHGTENDALFKDAHWRVGVAAHTHPHAVLREFYDESVGDMKLAVQLGSYQYDSAFGRKHNFPRARASGSCGLILWPNGSMQGWHDLQLAAAFLEYVRKKAQLCV